VLIVRFADNLDFEPEMPPKLVFGVLPGPDSWLQQRSSVDTTTAIASLRASRDLTTTPDANDLDRWNLYEFIQVAEKLGVIKPNRHGLDPNDTERICWFDLEALTLTLVYE
jgi:hypothetical protein